MRMSLVVLCLCVLVASATASASADWTNLLTNGAFTSSLSGWNASGAVRWDPNNGQPSGSAVVPIYAWGLLTQVVQVADADWNSSLQRTEYELKAKIRIYPTEDIHFKLGWWDNVVNAPGASAAPDRVVDLGNFTNTDSQWKDVGFRGYLECQPRWFSVRVEWNPNLNPGGDCHGWVDQLEFRARCANSPGIPEIPEPVSALLGCLGLSAVAAFRRMRRS